MLPYVNIHIYYVIFFIITKHLVLKNYAKFSILNYNSNILSAYIIAYNIFFNYYSTHSKVTNYFFARKIIIYYSSNKNNMIIIKYIILFLPYYLSKIIFIYYLYAMHLMLLFFTLQYENIIHFIINQFIRILTLLKIPYYQIIFILFLVSQILERLYINIYSTYIAINIKYSYINLNSLLTILNNLNLYLKKIICDVKNIQLNLWNRYIIKHIIIYTLYD